MINKLLRKKNIAIIAIFLAIFPIGSCDLDYMLLFFNCDECYSDRPQSGEVQLLLSKNKENQNIPITIYKGSFENNIVVDQYNFNYTYPKINVKTDTDYSIKAEYTNNGRTYIVVNKLKLKTRYESESCSEPCYYFVSRDVDLRLKL